MAQTGLSRTAFYRHFDGLTEVVMRLLDDSGQQLYAGGRTVAAKRRRRLPGDRARSAGGNQWTSSSPTDRLLVRAIAEAAVTDDESRARLQRLPRRVHRDDQTGARSQLVADGEIEVPDPLGMALRAEY